MQAIKKTVRMPAATLVAFLAALRSGEYKQGKFALEVEAPHDGRQKSYCCLGVLQMVVDGKVEVEDNRHFGPLPLAIPTSQWLHKNGIDFLNNNYTTASVPYLPTLRTSASSANDVYGRPFTEIADAFEACTETY